MHCPSIGALSCQKRGDGTGGEVAGRVCSRMWSIRTGPAALRRGLGASLGDDGAPKFPLPLEPWLVSREEEGTRGCDGGGRVRVPSPRDACPPPTCEFARVETWPLSRTHMGLGIWTAVSCQSRRNKEAEEVQAQVQQAGETRGGLQAALRRMAAVQTQGRCGVAGIASVARKSCRQTCARSVRAARGAHALRAGQHGRAG